MNIFEEKDYRTALRQRLLAKKAQFGRAFTFQKMAHACRVQKAYLSKAFSGGAHLSDDQAYLAANFLGFSTAEREFLMLLHALERSTVKARRLELGREIEQRRLASRRSEAHLTAKTTAAEAQDLADYYLDPFMQLVHMFLTVERYARDINLIARTLGLSKERLTDLLGRLDRAGIVAFEKGAFRVLRDNMHLPASSPIFAPYRTLMRLRALDQLQRGERDETFSFSAAISADPATRAALHARFLDFLKSSEELVRGAPQVEVYQMNFDLFRWSQ